MKNIVGFLAKHGGWVVLAFFVVYLAVFAFVTWPITSFSGKDIETMGQLGDSFGFLTSIFTALALWVALRLLDQNSQDMSLFRRQANMSYLVEKSKLQPNFSYSVSDKVGDSLTTQKYEKLLNRLGLDNHDSKCCIRVTTEKTDVLVHSKQRLIINFVENAEHKGENDRAFFIETERGPNFVLNKAEVANINKQHSFEAYFIYNDATMLPTINRLLIFPYNLKVEHVDTFYFQPGDDLREIETYRGCNKLMLERYESANDND